MTPEELDKQRQREQQSRDSFNKKLQYEYDLSEVNPITEGKQQLRD